MKQRVTVIAMAIFIIIIGTAQIFAANEGQGLMSVSPASAYQNQSGQTFTFVYTAGSASFINGYLAVTKPAGFSDFSTINTANGYCRIFVSNGSISSVTINANTIKIYLSTLQSNVGKVTIMYGYKGYGSLGVITGTTAGKNYFGTYSDPDSQTSGMALLNGSPYVNLLSITATITPTWSNTPIPSNTNTNTPTYTETPTYTNTPFAGSPTNSPTDTITLTATKTETPIASPTFTRTITQTFTITPVYTATSAIWTANIDGNGHAYNYPIDIRGYGDAGAITPVATVGLPVNVVNGNVTIADASGNSVVILNNSLRVSMQDASGNTLSLQTTSVQAHTWGLNVYAINTGGFGVKEFDDSGNVYSLTNPKNVDAKTWYRVPQYTQSLNFGESKAITITPSEITKSIFIEDLIFTKQYYAGIYMKTTYNATALCEFDQYLVGPMPIKWMFPKGVNVIFYTGVSSTTSTGVIHYREE